MATCSVDTLMDDAACFVCLTPKVQAAVQIALLKEIAGNTQTKDELVDAAADFIRLTEPEQQGVIAQLLCEISEA